MHRAMRILGTTLVVAGLAVVGWGFVTWQWGDPFTSLYTRWQQRELEEEYEQQAQRFALPPSPAVTAPTPAETRAHVRRAAIRLRRAAAEGDAIGHLQVPRLGLDMVLVNGTTASTLKKGPGRDPRSFMPGEGELVYVAGHRTTYGAPFAHIDRLEHGDRIVLRMPYAVATYQVMNHVIVPADDLARLRSRGREEVALQACHPRFSAKERYIVYARPVSITAVTRSGGTT